MKIDNSSGKANVTTGEYTGNDTQNRAIPHGLGRTPKIVFVIRNNGTSWFTIYTFLAAIFYLSASTNTYIAVTAIDGTNFYVGNAASYSTSANSLGWFYYWVAIG